MANVDVCQGAIEMPYAGSGRRGRGGRRNGNYGAPGKGSGPAGYLPIHLGFRRKPGVIRAGGDDLRREIASLIKKVGALERQAKSIRERIKGMAPAPKETREKLAVVDRLRCRGCGACQQVCPEGAIGLSYVARIDPERCTGCGVCVYSCTHGALSLVKA